MIRTGGGTFDPSDRFYYFLAANLENAKPAGAVHPHILIAVNELRGDYRSHLDAILGAGVKLFVDSGIFNLTNEHKRKTGCTMDEALALPPDQIDGFDKLWSRYVDIVERYGDRVWGYIELDQGGREQKILTRAKLEALGLKPIPVYHPLNDGWEYFDYLAERYDRICFGNIVQADEHMRQRLVATAWERHRKYPDLWIHLLGYTPNEALNAWPVNSADSSTWLAGRRWDGINERNDGRPFSRLEKNFQYVLGSDPTGDVGRLKGDVLAAYAAALQQRNWRNHLKAWERLGCDLYPAPAEATS